MNHMAIKRHLRNKLDDWIDSIDDRNVQEQVRNNAIITGGAIVSLLTNDKINDYDIYFRDIDAVKSIARYYLKKWNIDSCNKVFLLEEDNKIKVDLRKEGFVTVDKDVEENYACIYMTENAIGLSGKIQVIIKFYGDIDTLHSKFDYVHATCSYDYKNDKLILPSEALESIINKELIYMSSDYPMASIIRSYKFIKRGWHINAGQYVKILVDLNRFDLTDVDVLKEQLIGVDALEFMQVFSLFKAQDAAIINETYIMQTIEQVFG